MPLILPLNPDSDVSDVSEASEPPSETITDRILALRDIIPPQSRRRIASGYNKSYAWGSWGMTGGLKLAWQVSVSVLLLVVPFGLVLMEDQQIAMEEQQMRFRELGNDVRSSNSSKPKSTRVCY